MQTNKATIGLIWVALSLCAGTLLAGTRWSTDFENAARTAKEKHRYMLLDFSGSDWCGWCIRLEKEVFDKKVFKDYADENLVTVLIDFPSRKKLKRRIREQNAELKNAYKIQGFPTVIILSPNGAMVGRTGYREGGAENYVEHLKAMIDPHRKAHDIPLPSDAKGTHSRLGGTDSVFGPRPLRQTDLPRDETRKMRIWSSAGGATVEASLLEEKGAYIILRSAEGKTFKIGKARLSDGDREYIAQLKSDSAE